MNTRTMKVLVADDDPLNLRVAARHLKDLGHTGALVTDGVQVMRIIEQQTFDLVLLDLSMPNMDGNETLLALRAWGERKGQRLPVLMVTGHDDEHTKRHLLSAGADAVLHKPLTQSALLAAIRCLV